MSVSSTERLDELDALLPARPAGRNIIGFAIEAIKELRKDVVHWREARRTCLEAGDMMKTEIERLRHEVKLREQICADATLYARRLQEADDEIERLRGLLREARDNFVADMTEAEWEMRVREALGE